jgi:predicted glycosyltransferase
MKTSPTLLLDLNHPADFHFFRDFILDCRKKGIHLTITARQRKYLPELLNSYSIPYIKKRKWARTLPGKFLGLFRDTLQLYLLGRRIKPGVVISFASPYAAIAGKFLGTPVITFDDTDYNPLLHKIYPHFSDIILTPKCFQKSFGKKHIRFKGYKETVYLKNLAEEKKVQKEEITGLDQSVSFILVRFVSHHSTHELGSKGLKPKEKEEVVNRLRNYARVYISSEGPLPHNLKKYELNIPYNKIHHVLKKALLYFGESTTMASEAAVLGTPAVLIENKGRGYTGDIERRTGLLHRWPVKKWPKALEMAVAWLEESEKIIPEKIKHIEKITSETSNIGSFLIWITENPKDLIKDLKHSPETIKKLRTKGFL